MMLFFFSVFHSDCARGCLCMCLAPSQSQRDCVLQPRVARNELPWVGGSLNLNPERGPPKTLYRNLEERAGERRPFYHLRSPLFGIFQTRSERSLRAEGGRDACGNYTFQGPRLGRSSHWLASSSPMNFSF